MKTAVILFNLGGPDKLESVRPFLFNLFYDPAIINVPNPFRYLLARFISYKRAPIAQKIYASIGGKSPILEETKLQAQSLEQALAKSGEYKVFINMRYWHPLTPSVVKEVKEYNPDKIILLPLYPQYSTTTTASSIANWKFNARHIGLHTPTSIIISYPINPEFINAYSDLIQQTYTKANNLGKPVLLFSAHGIPANRVIKKDPYSLHVKQTVKAIVKQLNINNLEYQICYQSKVGPLRWLTPSTENKIIEYAKQNRVIVVAPVSFVSEHSETLAELDIEYRELAEHNKCKGYFRVPTVRNHESFIKCLTELCLANSA